jgi:hypothetical protein
MNIKTKMSSNNDSFSPKAQKKNKLKLTNLSLQMAKEKLKYNLE